MVVVWSVFFWPMYLFNYLILDRVTEFHVPGLLCNYYSQIPCFANNIAFLQEFKIAVVPILPWQPEEDLPWWPVDLCRGPRCGWHGDGVKWEPQTAVHVHKQAASDCPRRHIQRLWFPHEMIVMPPPRRPSVSAHFWLILCPMFSISMLCSSFWKCLNCCGVASRPVVL